MKEIFKKFQKFRKPGKWDQFSHLSQGVRAGQRQGIKIMMVGVLCFFTLGVLVILMMNYSGSSGKAAKSMQHSKDLTDSPDLSAVPAESLQSIDHMSRIFEENENKIKELQKVTQTILESNPSAAHAVMQDAASGAAAEASALVDQEKWRLRKSAKTTVYETLQTQDGRVEGDSAGAVSQMLKKETGLIGQYETMEASATQDIASAVGVLMPHPYDTVAQGELIHGVLETAINSELPGMVRAQITDPIYAYRGSKILIPAGSRLVGQYASSLQNGASSARIFIMWNRIITPQGLSILINSPGVDNLGRSGLSADAIDHHFFQIFGQAVLLSVLGGGASTWGVSDEAQPNSADQFRQSVASSFQESASKAYQSNAEAITPTLHVYQGEPVVIFVAKDLDLSQALDPS
jgi:type IV secretory pathway VirB10-like protein